MVSKSLLQITEDIQEAVDELLELDEPKVDVPHGKEYVDFVISNHSTEWKNKVIELSEYIIEYYQTDDKKRSFIPSKDFENQSVWEKEEKFGEKEENFSLLFKIIFHCANNFSKERNSAVVDEECAFLKYFNTAFFNEVKRLRDDSHKVKDDKNVSYLLYKPDTNDDEEAPANLLDIKAAKDYVAEQISDKNLLENIFDVYEKIGEFSDFEKAVVTHFFVENTSTRFISILQKSSCYSEREFYAFYRAGGYDPENKKIERRKNEDVEKDYGYKKSAYTNTLKRINKKAIEIIRNDENFSELRVFF